MNFLCPHHREQILHKPAVAISFWDQWMQQGAELFNQQQWPQAASFLGCSFEVGEWLLAKPELISSSDRLLELEQNLSHVDRYMLAGHHLSECLGRNDQTELELHYLLKVHLQLLSILKARQYQRGLLRNHLKISLAMLSRHCQLHGQFKGYRDCYMETSLCINQCLN
ncbi:MAG: hypothetical protein WCY88_17075 [Spongiibacteraceae bacterium]